MKQIKIRFDVFDRKIMTFGSGLSRLTAQALRDVYGAAPPACSVAGNRSDMFIRDFIEGNDLPAELEDVRRLADLEPARVRAFLRQKRNFLGLWDPAPGVKKQTQTGFWDLAAKKDAGLIIADNLTDVTAREVFLDDPRFRDTPFLLGTLKPGRDRLIPGGWLEPERSARNFERILSFLREKFPEAEIVFLTCPPEAYPPESAAGRRCRRFAESFAGGAADLVVETHILSGGMKSDKPGRFHDRFYAALAGQIRHSLD